jgi:alpha-mannosidase
LFGIEDCVDRGDSYDADCDPPRDITTTQDVARSRHPSGIERLSVRRELEGIGTLDVTATVAPGVPYVRCDVRLDNRASDHRLRLRFPTRAELGIARTTFDATPVTVTRPDDTGWVHPAPHTFIHHGWIDVDGLVVGAPGLPEAELTEDALFITLVRSVGMLARIRLRTRPVPAAPEMPAPGAQCIGPINATIVIAADSREAEAAEIGLWGVLGDTHPLLAGDASLLELHAERSVLSACKPAERGDGVVVRVLNPSAHSDDVTLRFGLDIAQAIPVRLDETPSDEPIDYNRRAVHLDVPAHALRSVVVQTLRR